MDRRNFIASLFAAVASLLCFWRVPKSSEPSTAELLHSQFSRMAGNLDAMGTLGDLPKWIEREVNAIARRLKPNSFASATWGVHQHDMIDVHVDELLGNGRVLTCRFLVHMSFTKQNVDAQRSALRVRTMDAMSERVERSLFDAETAGSVPFTGKPLFA